MKQKDILELIGRCGFYCGSCPDYVQGDCPGCRDAHQAGDCFTFDCVGSKQIDFCGLCEEFPCREILTREKATVLDRRWLLWKAGRRTSQKQED
jgi:hypothetical protein